MNNANLLKGTAIVLILIVALVVFDSYSGNSSSKITAYAVAGTSAGALSIDLANYPELFVKDGKLDALIVVGDKASSDNVIASADIATGLLQSGGIQVGAAKLASEVADPFAQNIISVGTGCSNAVTSAIQIELGQIDGRRCWNGALTGEGMGAITLYDFGNGKVGLVVEGYADEDVRRAAKVLMSYKDWKAAGKLQGIGILVEKLTSEGGTKLSGYGWGSSATSQACPSTITVTSNKQTAYSQGETAVFTITMQDSAGNIVKRRGASLSISSATATPALMFSKAFPATDSGVIIVSVPLTASIYQQGGYAVQVSSEAGSCSPVSGGQSFAVQAVTDQTGEVGYAGEVPRIDTNDIMLAPGWNLISVTPPMAGKSLHEMNESGSQIRELKCAISVAWLYVNDPGRSSQWLLVQNSGRTLPDNIININTFSNKHIGLGMWAKVENDKYCYLDCGITGCQLTS